MAKPRPSGFRTYTSHFAVVVAAATAIGLGGCSASVSSGPGAADGGDDGAATGGCTPSDCAGLAAPATAKLCPDGSSVGATLCTRQSSGMCGWGFPACPSGEAGSCPGLGCFPSCPNGVLKDSNGCDTCQCAPASDAGGTSDAGGCVSPQGGPCGGNTSRPCTCAAGLTCTPGEGGAPFGDVGGTCQ